MSRMDLVPERGRTPDPCPGDGLAALLPDPNPPLTLATRVLEAHPGDVADVVLDVGALEPPELADERLHATCLCEGVRHSATVRTPLEHLPRLRAEDEQTTVEHEGRYSVDAEGVRLARSKHARGRHTRRPRAPPPPPRRRGRPRRRAQAAPPGRRCSCLPPSRRPSAGRGRLVEPSLARELGDAQRSHRVRDDVGVRAVDEAVRLEHPSHAVDARLAVALEQSLSRQAFLRVLRMQIEGEPRDLRAEPALEPVGRRLADAAERSDVVGPDEDFVLAHSDLQPAGCRPPSRGGG